jgi:hypothetical protein
VVREQLDEGGNGGTGRAQGRASIGSTELQEPGGGQARAALGSHRVIES